jgi:transcription initiation factor IIE alpha subunit
MPHPAGVSSEQTIAETLPCLFREVLDALARLEELGARADAARLRSEAIEGYSRAWDLACQKRLERLLGRIDNAVRDLERRRQLSVA